MHKINVNIHNAILGKIKESFNDDSVSDLDNVSEGNEFDEEN